MKVLDLEDIWGPTYKSLSLSLDHKVLENCQGLCILQTVRYVSHEADKFGYRHHAWDYGEEWFTCLIYRYQILLIDTYQ